MADALLAEMVADHPAVLVTGPRATGKTTTAAREAKSVIQLADDRQATAFRADPHVGLLAWEEPILLDEWQVVPESLGAMKVLIDAEPRRGRFIVTGSVRGALDSPMWPGTGRLVRLPMYGLTEREIEHRLGAPSWLDGVLRGEVAGTSTDLNLTGYLERAFRSGFPEPALALGPQARSRWLSSYVDQLVTRDAKGVEAGRDPVRLRRYLQALALNSAGIVDDVTLYEAAHIGKDTSRAYDQLLQNLLVIEKIPAWTSNRLKRLALASKRYLVDAGLFTGVLGVDIAEALRDGDLLGRVIETFVVAQIRAELALLSPSPRLHHLRTAQGRQEIDLIIEVGARRVVAIEIKATASPDADDARHLRWLQDELGDAVIAAIVFHTGPNSFPLGDRIIASPIASLWS
jgi:predicted AAA+ superfamily ATPase